MTYTVCTTDRDGYANETLGFGTYAKAKAEAELWGDCYIVMGTQMWNEPLGQIEERDTPARYWYVR